MANVTYTFVAGTKAQASQVNKNFQDCINGINQNASDIAQNASDISSLQSSKANKNGSSSERFSVANPTAPNEAVNKQTLENAITPVLDYINGLIITKSSNTEVAVSSGSCFDTTKAQVLILSSSYTASYSGTLSASTTYDVFIRKSKSTSTVDCVILAHESEPSSSDYYYRKIGEVITDSSAYISGITNYSNSSIGFIPDYTNGETKTKNTEYTATTNGYFYVCCSAWGGDSIKTVIINGVSFNILRVTTQYGDTSVNVAQAIMFPLKKGDIYKYASSAGDIQLLFIPMKGGN